VYSTCRRFLVKKDTLEDAIQSVFLLYIKKEDSISSNLSSWFYWASVNVCKVVNKETLKHAEKSSPLFENTAVNDESQPQEELFSDLGLVLDKLPTKKRDMLLMRYYDNKSYREIGSFYKSSEDSVQKMIDRTIQFLKSEVKRKENLNSVFFAQFFGLNSTSIATISANKFILQNSFLQQSFIKGVQKMYLISKLKYALILCLCLSIPLGLTISVFNKAQADQPNVKKSEESQRVEKTKSIVLQKEGNNQNSNNNQKVVDQTLRSPIVKEEQPQANKDVLSSINEKAEIEITLYDGEQNKLLIDYSK
jgi:RNA polymerase sigma-70 factor (ECF subfamily)